MSAASSGAAGRPSHRISDHLADGLDVAGPEASVEGQANLARREVLGARQVPRPAAEALAIVAEQMHRREVMAGLHSGARESLNDAAAASGVRGDERHQVRGRRVWPAGEGQLNAINTG